MRRDREHEDPGVLGNVRGTRTIERTGKIWKLQMLLGGLGIVIGTVLAVIALAAPGEQGLARDEGPSTMAIAGGVVFAISVIWYLLARLAAWWFHG